MFGHASRLKRRRTQHLANAACVLDVLAAADIPCSWTQASAGPPTIRTDYGKLTFQDDGAIRLDRYVAKLRAVQ